MPMQQPADVASGAWRKERAGGRKERLTRASSPSTDRNRGPISRRSDCSPHLESQTQLVLATQLPQNPGFPHSRDADLRGDEPRVPNANLGIHYSTNGLAIGMDGPDSHASVLNPRMGLMDGAGGADRAAFGLQPGGHGRAGRVAGQAAHLVYRMERLGLRPQSRTRAREDPACVRQRLGPPSIDAKARLDMPRKRSILAKKVDGTPLY